MAYSYLGATAFDSGYFLALFQSQGLYGILLIFIGNTLCYWLLKRALPMEKVLFLFY